MANTPVYSLPYPTNNDGPYGPAQIQALAEATEAELVRVDSDIIDTRRPPSAHLRQTVAQNIANNTWTALTWHTADIDTAGGWTSGSRYVCKRPGRYRLSGGATWAASATGQRWSRWALNGTEIPGSGSSVNATAAGQALVPSRDIQVELALGDYIELQVSQSSGGTLATYVSVPYAQSTMTVEWVGE